MGTATEEIFRGVDPTFGPNVPMFQGSCQGAYFVVDSRDAFAPTIDAFEFIAAVNGVSGSSADIFSFFAAVQSFTHCLAP